MAQLPPKIPNVTPSNWPDLFSSHHNQKMPSMASLSQPNNGTAIITTTHHSPSWMDGFLDFSSARRGAHRRSVSDSITFMEAETGIPARSGAENSEFDRFDEEQFMRMFNDEMSDESSMHPPPNLSSSSPSDHNSINDEKEMSIRQNQKEEEQLLKNESDEVESQCKYQEPHAPNNTSPTCSSDKITDPKRVKRILANRQSAQRSRVRKLQYISELERSVTSLQAEVSVLSPRVAFLDHQRLLLNVDNSALKQRIAALAQDNIFKDAHHEALKGEIERLREVYQQQQQNLKKMKSGGGSPS